MWQVIITPHSLFEIGEFSLPVETVADRKMRINI